MKKLRLLLLLTLCLLLCFGGFSGVSAADGASYTITAGAGNGGAISPAGDTQVKAGESQRYSVTPYEGYHIDDIVVDGKSVGNTYYTTVTVSSADRVIHALFKRFIPKCSVHSWDGGVVTSLPTIHDDGLKNYTCTVCSAIQTETIPAYGCSGHVWGEYQTLVAAGCETTGIEGHSCSVCDEMECRIIEAAGHSWGAYTPVGTPSCTAPGDYTRSCTVCKLTETVELPAIPHSWDKGVVSVPATPNSDGALVYTCTACKTTKTVIIPAGAATGETAAPGTPEGAALGEGSPGETGGAPTDGSGGTAGTTGTTASTRIFTDVAPTDWFYADVYGAVGMGLVDGFAEANGSYTYRPTGDLTIAQAIKLAACMNQFYSTGAVTLANAPAGNWYDSYLAYAVEKGIVAAGEYNALLNSKATRAQYASIFAKALPESEFSVRNQIADGAVPDVAVGHPAAAAVYKLYRAGILTGNTQGEFLPGANIKRSEVAAILNRMMDPAARRDVAL